MSRFIEESEFLRVCDLRCVEHTHDLQRTNHLTARQQHIKCHHITSHHIASRALRCGCAGARTDLTYVLFDEALRACAQTGVQALVPNSGQITQQTRARVTHDTSHVLRVHLPSHRGPSAPVRRRCRRSHCAAAVLQHRAGWSGRSTMLRKMSKSCLMRR